jgi:predicted amidophosphoribosyltransferase
METCVLCRGRIFPQLNEVPWNFRWIFLWTRTCPACLDDLPYSWAPRPARVRDAETYQPLWETDPQVARPSTGLKYIDVGRPVIRKVKFERSRNLSRLWAWIFSLALEESRELHPPPGGKVLLVPMASSAYGLWYRGWEPVWEATKTLGALRGIPTQRLLRKKQGGSQKSRNRQERVDHGQDFDFLARVTIPEDIAEIILLDDVITTGSTLDQGSRLLRTRFEGSIRPLGLVQD